MPDRSGDDFSIHMDRGLIIQPEDGELAPFGNIQPQIQTAPIIVDGHVDLPYHMEKNNYRNPFIRLEHGPWTIAKAKQAGVKIWGTALYCEDSFNGPLSFRHFNELLGFTQAALEDITIIRKERDLEEFGTFLVLENADCLAERPGYAGELPGLGIIIVGLTHAGKNRLADGNSVRYSDGITREGREAVKALETRGVLIDVAHLHERCFWELMKSHEGPVVSSHTGIREICDLPRNLTVSQAKEIIERRGIIGITVNPEMLCASGHASLNDVYVHIDTLVQRFGPWGVGIGSDFCGFDVPAEGVEDVGGLVGISETLMSHGYGEEAVKAIMGGNWIRLLKTLLNEL